MASLGSNLDTWLQTATEEQIDAASEWLRYWSEDHERNKIETEAANKARAIRYAWGRIALASMDWRAERVYFIRAVGVGLIKVGVSNHPYARLHSLQCASPTKLELLAIAFGGYEVERQLHFIFREARIRGEWFEPVPELLKFIRTLHPIFPHQPAMY